MKKLYFELILALSLFGIGFLLSFPSQAQSSFGDASGGVGNLMSNSGASAAGTNIPTGTIAPAFPLLTVPGTSGGVALGLRYTAGAGVKVNDVASEVGLGWVLTGTGAITREVRGYPDDSNYGWFIAYGDMQAALSIQDRRRPSPWPTPLATAGSLVSYYKKTYRKFTPDGYYSDYGANEPGALDYYLDASQAFLFSNYNWNTHTYGSVSPSFVKNLDTQPDVYTVSLPTGGVQFVFDDNGTPIPLQAQNIRIEALNLGNRAPGTLLHEFRITTNDGTQYLFGSPAGDNSYKESETVTTAILSPSTIPSKADYACVYKWLLKKITYPDGEEITYQYKSEVAYEMSTHNYLQQDYIYTMYNNRREYTTPYIIFPLTHSTSATSAPTGWSRAYTVRATVSSSDCKQLATITTSQGSVELTYETTARLDVGGNTKALAGITLRNKQNLLVKSLQFSHHYADAGTGYSSAYTLPYDRYHLLLDKVVDQGAGCDYTQLYYFTYNPNAFLRNSDGKDDWGYLNSNVGHSATTVGAYTRGNPYPATTQFTLAGRDRTPSLAYAQALILQNVKLATGAETTFAYELHAANNYAGAVGGLRIKAITQYDGLDHANDLTESFGYTTSSGSSSGVLGDVGCYAKLRFMHGVPTYDGQYNNNVRLTDDQIRGDIPGCVFSDPNNIKDSYYVLRSDASFYTYASDYVDYSLVTITHGSKGKSKYEFTSWADASRQDFADGDCRLHAGQLSPCTDDPLRGNKRGAMIPIPFSVGLTDMNINYSGGPGVTAGFPRRTSRAAERGLLTKLTQLTNTDVAVAITTNEYDFAHPDVPLPVVNALIAQTDMEVLGFTQYYNYFELYYYQLIPTWTPLTKTTQVVYDQNANGNIAKTLTNTTQVSYTNFLPQTTIRYTGAYPGIGQNRYVTETRYPQNFSGNDADQVTTPGLLRKAGMMGVPVEQEEYLNQATGNCSKIPRGATLTEYQLLNNRVLPYRTYVAPAGLTCFAAATTGNSSGTWTLNKDANYQLTSTLTGYTADNRPVNMSDRSGVGHATIWGHNHTLPIATVMNGQATTGSGSNALLATAAHTSFEEDGADGDAWALPDFLSTTEAKTGSRSARIVVSQRPYGPGKYLTIPAGASRHGKLIYSFWVKVPAGKTGATAVYPVVTGQGNNSGWNAGNLQVQPNQDWQYVQTVIDLDNSTWTSGLSSTDNLQLFLYPWCPSGSELLIDEVRVHRDDAIMQTMTYLPLVGKSSSTDPSGVTTYFTYDVNNQPRLTLNQNRDIVQRTQGQLLNQNARPSASFNMPDVTAQDCPVQLVADYSTCANSTFTWDFGDGTKAINSTGSQSHNYSRPGTYSVSLLVSDPQRGAARISKVLTVNEPYHTDIQIAGSTYADLCANPNPDPVTLTATVQAGDCHSVIGYQWQTQDSNGQWAYVSNSATITCRIQQGTQYFRCLIITPTGNNSNSPTLQTIALTGYRDPTRCDQYQPY